MTGHRCPAAPLRRVADDSESVERGQRGRDFAAAYVAKPEME
ncbi:MULTISPECIES: hypothetical protein [unclassified Streptomyces]|nr:MULTISPECIES: hypothetical protein [unclassified Streptomyces]